MEQRFTNTQHHPVVPQPRKEWVKGRRLTPRLSAITRSASWTTRWPTLFRAAIRSRRCTFSDGR